MNTIIGGRSSGKSILLGCIARLCGDKTPIKPNKPQYDTYINDISQCMKLHWRDSGKEIKRKIDFFPQSYIIEMASDPQKIKELIENIMRDENGENRDNDFINKTKNLLLMSSACSLFVEKFLLSVINIDEYSFVRECLFQLFSFGMKLHVYLDQSDNHREYVAKESFR